MTVQALVKAATKPSVVDALVAEWMTPNPYTCTVDASLADARDMMAENRCRRLPVVDDEGDLIGILRRQRLSHRCVCIVHEVLEGRRVRRRVRRQRGAHEEALVVGERERSLGAQCGAAGAPRARLRVRRAFFGDPELGAGDRRQRRAVRQREPDPRRHVVFQEARESARREVSPHGDLVSNLLARIARELLHELG